MGGIYDARKPFTGSVKVACRPVPRSAGPFRISGVTPPRARPGSSKCRIRAHPLPAGELDSHLRFQVDLDALYVFKQRLRIGERLRLVQALESLRVCEDFVE